MSNLIAFLRDVPVKSLVSSSPKSHSLFEAIRTSKLKSREEIEDQYFQRPLTESVFYELLSKLESDVINSIICENPTKIPLRVSYRYVQRVECAVKILERTGRNEQAVYLAEKALKKSRLYDFTAVTLSLAEVCRYHYAISGNRKKFEFFNELCNEVSELYNYERRAEALHDQLIFAISQKKANLEEEGKLAEEIFQELTPIKDKSNRTLVIWGVVGVILHMIKNEPQEVINICKSVLNVLFPQSDIVYLSWIFTFLLYMIPCQLKAGQTRSAIQYINQFDSSKTLQPFNKIILQQYKFIVAMHQRDFSIAESAIFKLQSYRLNEIQKEIFEVHQSYLLLLTNQPLRLARFINQVPIYSKDKAGMNVNIIIIQMLFLIREQKHYEFIDRSAAVLRYLHRHLKKSKNKRSTYFIQAILELETINFQVSKMDRIPSIKKLKKYSYTNSEQDFDVEIVPYEFLWEMVGEWLEN